MSCFGNTDGIVYAGATGGTPPYTYQWNNGATTPSISGLGVGFYSVTITDANGCISNAGTNLIQPSPLGGGTVITQFYGSYHVSCPGATDAQGLAFSYSGTVDNATGVAPYFYEWSNGQTTPAITNVGAGTYTVTTTDANGCLYVDSITFLSPPERAVTINLDFPIDCAGNASASISASATGGNGVDTYLWSNGVTTNFATGLTAGTYTVTVEDTDGCAGIDSIVISDPVPMVITGTLTEPSCIGMDGEIVVDATGGTGPYTYQWNPGPTGNTITGIGPGTYYVAAYDIHGCEKIDSFTFLSNNTFTYSINKTDLTCGGGDDGSIDLEILSGIGPYTYSWSEGSTTQDLSGLAAATYTVTITDVGLSCTKIDSVLVESTRVGANIAFITNFGGDAEVSLSLIHI